MPFPCHKDANCTNNVGSFSCNCSTGFVGDGVEVCTGEPPQSFKFSLLCCMYYRDYFSLLDIDECMETPRHCADVCTNTRGSFACSCIMSGYQLATNGRNCVGKSITYIPCPVPSPSPSPSITMPFPRAALS